MMAAVLTGGNVIRATTATTTNFTALKARPIAEMLSSETAYSEEFSLAAAVPFGGAFATATRAGRNTRSPIR